MAPDTKGRLLQRNEELQERLREAEETLRALRCGEVDAVVVAGPNGDRVYTLKGADEPYRVLVEGMSEGALTLTLDGLILFSNAQFASIVRTPLERVIGSRIQDFVAPEDAGMVSALFRGNAGRKAEVRLTTDGATLVPVYMSAENLVLDVTECVCLVVTDLSEQKRNQATVAAERLARSILEQAAEAILVVDLDGRISRASGAAESLAGAPVVQREFDQMFRISLGSSKDYSFREILSAVKANRSIKNLEATAVAPDGREIDLLLSAARLSGPDSELLGCVVNLTDISDRKRREQQLKFQADILETTAEAVVAFDPNGRVTFWNSGAERLYGISRPDALGKPLTDLRQCVWLTPDGEQQALASLYQDGMWSGENIQVCRDGRRIFASETVNLLGPAHGGGMFAIIRDITENKKAETILRESEARERSRAAELQAIMEAVPAAVFIARDREARDMTGNRMSYDLSRVTPGANLSSSAPEMQRPKHFHTMKNGEEVPLENLPIQLAARSGQPVYNSELDIAFDDGVSRCWFGNAVPLFDESGRSRGAIGAFIDITERKIAQVRLGETQKLESIGVLAGGLAHDFNNLLVGVIGHASLAQEMLPPGDPTFELLQRVIQAGDQLANLTRQMLAYAGKGRFVEERLDLSALVPKMNGLVQPSLPKKIALQFDLEPGLPPIEADRGQIQQIYMNLVLNAAEAIGDGRGTISVKTGVQAVDEQYVRRHPEAAELSPGTYVYLEVRDTGCGMDAATKAKVFDPFFTTKFVGRGLGLAAVSGIVRGHKGVIKVTSTPGKGSCFTALLPAVPGAIASQQAAEERVAGRKTGTILVVDDEDIVRGMAKAALTHHGFDVLLANNGLEAIDIIRRHPEDISLVVLDLSMPGMSGEEALPEIRKIRPGVKVVISSGYNEAETMERFKNQRVSGFIQKPYTSVRLAEKVKSTLQ